MILIANSTLHVSKQTRAPEKDDKGNVKRDNKGRPDRGEFEQMLLAPRDEFDPAEFSIGEDEIDELLKTGKVKRKVRTVDDDRHEPIARSNPPSETDQGDKPQPQVTSKSQVSIKK